MGHIQEIVEVQCVISRPQPNFDVLIRQRLLVVGLFGRKVMWS